MNAIPQTITFRPGRPVRRVHSHSGEWDEEQKDGFVIREEVAQRGVQPPPECDLRLQYLSPKERDAYARRLEAHERRQKEEARRAKYDERMKEAEEAFHRDYDVYAVQAAELLRVGDLPAFQELHRPELSSYRIRYTPRRSPF